MSKQSNGIGNFTAWDQCVMMAELIAIVLVAAVVLIVAGLLFAVLILPPLWWTDRQRRLQA